MSKVSAPHDHSLRGVLLVCMAALLWSLGGLIVRMLGAVDPWTIVFWRSVFASLFLLSFILARDGPRGAVRLFRDTGLPGVAIGLCFTAASVGFVVALSFASVAQTLVIMSSAPLIAAVLGRLFLGERIAPLGYVAIAGVMAGITLMMSADIGAERSLFGGVIAFAVACTIAGSGVIARRWPHIRMTPGACIGTVVAMLVSWPLAAPLSVSGPDLLILVFFGAAQLGVGIALFVTGARLIPAVLTSLLGMLEPILGPGWVWLFLGEEPGAVTIAGGAIVVASVAAYTMSMTRGLSRR